VGLRSTEGTTVLAGERVVTVPNKALHLTAYSVRSCLAPASGSR
jgi:hypothetical protein